MLFDIPNPPKIVTPRRDIIKHIAHSCRPEGYNKYTYIYTYIIIYYYIILEVNDSSEDTDSCDEDHSLAQNSYTANIPILTKN